MPERIVLLFAYHFPPENTIGGLRPYNFCKYLSRMGYRCHVVTAAEQDTEGPFDSVCVPDTFETHRGDGVGWHVERAIRKTLMPGATGMRWSQLACEVAERFVRSNPNAELTIYSTYPPLGPHLAALRLKRRTLFKWIADFRDPLGDNPAHLGLNSFQEQLHRWTERILVRNADVVIANTDALAERFKHIYPNYESRVHLIWNGFDPEDGVGEQPLPQRKYRVFSHTGELYGGRNVTPLLESFARLIDAGRLTPGGLRVRLVGAFKKDSVPPPEFLERAQAQGWLELIPKRVPREEALVIAQDSDGLLLVQPHSAVQVPGKLFDYLRVGRPILAFIAHDTPIERLLSQSGVPYRCAYADSSATELDEVVQSFVDLKANSSRANNSFVENFDAERQTATLENLIRWLHK